MRVVRKCCAAMFAAAGVLFSWTLGSRPDEPVKPTASASEANPAVPAPAIRCTARRSTTDRGMLRSSFRAWARFIFRSRRASPRRRNSSTRGWRSSIRFYYFESERSFRQAAKLDPSCAMAYWGMAMSNINNPRRAKGVPQGSAARGGGDQSARVALSGRLEAFFKDGGNVRSQRQGWLQGLESGRAGFSRRHRCAGLAGDGDLAERDGRDRQQAGASTWSLIRCCKSSRCIRSAPLPHPPLGRIESVRAEKSAELYAKTAPGIAHAWHMPGHTFTELKRYADAAYQQEGSARADHAYMIRDRVMPFEIHNYAHNNQWLCTSLSHIGRVRDAIAVARNLVEQPRDPAKNGPNDGGSAQRSGAVLAGRRSWLATSSGTT